MSASKLREAVRGAQDNPDATVRLQRADLDELTLVNFDPSLSATGWSILQHTEAELELVRTGTVKWERGLDGVDQKGAAGDALFIALVPLLTGLKADYPALQAAIEAPPNAHTNRLSRTDSAEAAMNRIRSACQVAGIPIRSMVNIQHHKHLLTGNKGADKKLVKACLTLLGNALPIKGLPLATNGDQRDSVCVGITSMYDAGRGR